MVAETLNLEPSVVRQFPRKRLAISLWPYVVPRQVTIWSGAADQQSLQVLFAGVSIILPIIVAYTGYAYWVFRGKAIVGEGHNSPCENRMMAASPTSCFENNLHLS